MKVEIFGPGCPRCHQTYQELINAAAELNLEVDIELITDMPTLTARGIMQTPAVAVDGRVVMKGRVPTRREAKDLLQGKSAK